LLWRQISPLPTASSLRQRVAIARALLIQPSLLLMDEPLASLDMARKQEIMSYLQHLREHLDIPVIYVSHSVEEVANLASHVIVLEDGKIQACGTPEQVFTEQLSASKDSSSQASVIWQGVIRERADIWHLARIHCAGGDLWGRDTGLEEGSNVGIAIQANNVSLSKAPLQDSSVLNQLPVTVSDVNDDSDRAFMMVRLLSENTHLLARVTRRSVNALNIKAGDKLWAHIKSAAIVR